MSVFDSIAQAALKGSAPPLLQRPQPGQPVYRSPAPPTMVSYSGQDIRASIYFGGKLTPLCNLYTLSYSTHRDVIPVRGLGQAGALAHARGYRTIAGSMVFVQFNKDALYDFISFTAHDRNASGWYPVLVDQIPPFNLLIEFCGETLRTTYAPEYGQWTPKGQSAQPPSSQMVIYQISLSDNGSTLSVDDLITEGILSYHALGIMPVHDTIDRTMSGSPQTTAEDALRLLREAKGQDLSAYPGAAALASSLSAGASGQAQPPATGLPGLPGLSGAPALSPEARLYSQSATEAQRQSLESFIAASSQQLASDAELMGKVQLGASRPEWTMSEMADAERVASGSFEDQSLFGGFLAGADSLYQNQKSAGDFTQAPSLLTMGVPGDPEMTIVGVREDIGDRDTAVLLADRFGSFGEGQVLPAAPKTVTRNESVVMKDGTSYVLHAVKKYKKEGS